MTENIFLSVIVPYHKKCGDIRPGIEKLLSFLNKRSFRSEILIISQNTVMFQDTPQNPGSKISLKILTSSDEKSQNGAYITGFKNALGEWVILLDADMISYTLMIDRVISEMFGSQDVIRTFRVNFSRKSPFRKIGSWIINAVFNFGNDKKLRDVGSSLSAYRQNIYRNVYDTRFNKYHFFLPFAVVALAEKNKIKEIPIEIPPTKHTGSAYSICALLRITFKVVFMKILTLTSRR